MTGKLLFAMLITGCVAERPEPPTPDRSSPGVTSLPEAPVVEACESITWSKLVPAAADMDLSVIDTERGSTMLAVPRAGGEVEAYAFDKRGQLTASAKLGEGRSTAGSYTDGHLFTAIGDGQTIHVSLVADDLSSSLDIGKLDGTRTGKSAVLDARGVHVAPALSSAGLTDTAFDATWTPQASILVAESKPAADMATTRFGQDVMVVWSTSSECHLERLTGIASGSGSMQPLPCYTPSIAADVEHGTAIIAYEMEGVIHYMNAWHDELDPAWRGVHPGSSPRALFDGTHYWIAYIDPRGDVVAGYLNAEGELVSTTTSIHPGGSKAYELVKIDGGVWVYGANAEGYTAEKLCL